MALFCAHYFVTNNLRITEKSYQVFVLVTKDPKSYKINFASAKKIIVFGSLPWPVKALGVGADRREKALQKNLGIYCNNADKHRIVQIIQKN